MLLLPSSAAPWPSNVVGVSYELVVVVVGIVAVVVALIVVVQLESEPSDVDTAVDTAVDTDEYIPELFVGHAMCREN